MTKSANHEHIMLLVKSVLFFFINDIHQCINMNSFFGSKEVKMNLYVYLNLSFVFIAVRPTGSVPKRIESRRVDASKCGPDSLSLMHIATKDSRVCPVFRYICSVCLV